MPRLSDTMEEGVIVEWLKQVGDPVEPGDILAEVETDKATMELESYHEGVLLHIGVKEGAVPVNGVLAVIGEKDEDFQSDLDAAQAELTSASTSEAESGVSEAPDDNDNIEQPSNDGAALQTSNGSMVDDGRVKASPLARRMAEEKGLALSGISGSGEGGRIIKQDIISHLKSASESGTQLPNQSFSGLVPREEGISQMRKVIAKRLSESKFSSPHFYVTIAIDMENVIQIRKDINATAPPKISFNDFIVKATAMALRAHPSVNSSWLGDKIRYNGSINIGVAVAVNEGLMVPVVTHADQKGLATINQEVKELAGRARERKLQPDEMQGNTFTISNLGMFDVDEFTAIINPPDACILAVGSIVEKPIVKDGQIKVGHIMKVTLSSDHRVVDGAIAAAFLQTLKSYLEQPMRMML